MKDAKLKCDNKSCDWHEIGNPHNWHNKKCPSCNDCIIITNEDMVIIKGLEALESLGVIKTGKEAENGNGIKFQVDSAPNRT